MTLIVATTLKEVYAQIPVMRCKGTCWTTCAHIPVFSREASVIKRKHGLIIPVQSNPCPALNKVTHKCGIYANRPFICRLWGVAEGLECAEGCESDGFLSDADAGELMAQMADLSGEHLAAANFRLTYMDKDSASAKLFRTRLGTFHDARRMHEQALPDQAPPTLDILITRGARREMA